MTISVHPLVLGTPGMCSGMLVQMLSKAKINPRASYHDQAELGALQHINVEAIQTDCNDVESLVAAMNGITVAALILPINADMAAWGHNTIAAAKQAGLSRLVLLTNANADPKSKYAIPRMQGEIITELQKSGVPYQIVKSSPYFQHILFSQISLVQRHEFSLPIGDIEMPLIDMHDTAIYVAKLLCEERPLNTIHNITGSTPIPMARAARFLGKALNQNVRYFPVPLDNSTHIFHAMSLPNWLGEAITDIYAEYSTGNYSTSTSDFKNLVGRQPIGLEDWIERNLAIFHEDAVPGGLLKTGN